MAVAARAGFFNHRVGNALRNLPLLIGRAALEHGDLDKGHRSSSSQPSAVSKRSCWLDEYVSIRLRVPQGLKPEFLQALDGTAEAVPYPKPIYEASSARPAATDG